MHILAIETSVATGSIAIVSDQETIIDQPLPATERNAKTLASALKRVLDEFGRDRLQGVAVSMGPGSFTGLRVGIATAKTLAWALGLPVVGVPTLTAVACQASEHIWSSDQTDGPVRLSVASNAYRSQVFVSEGALAHEESALGQTFDIIEHAKWLSQLPRGGVDWVSGPALAIPIPENLQHALKKVQVTPESLWEPRAATIGRLGLQRLLAGDAASPEALLPDYGRLSAAEEKRQQRDATR